MMLDRQLLQIVARQRSSVSDHQDDVAGVQFWQLAIKDSGFIDP